MEYQPQRYADIVWITFMSYSRPANLRVLQMLNHYGYLLILTMNLILDQGLM